MHELDALGANLMGVTADRTELRRDPTAGQWVLVRKGALQPTRTGSCRFCPGHEAQISPDFAYKQRCLYCDIIYQQGRDGICVIEQTWRFPVYTP